MRLSQPGAPGSYHRRHAAMMARPYTSAPLPLPWSWIDGISAIGGRFGSGHHSDAADWGHLGILASGTRRGTQHGEAESVLNSIGSSGRAAGSHAGNRS